MTVNVDAAIFNAVYRPYLDDMTRTQIFFGGSSSGKSVFLAQRTVFDVLKGGRNYLICREVGRTIRRSVFNEVSKAIYDYGLRDLFTINQTDLLITCANGYQIIFAGLDDVHKLKSITPAKGVITDIWVEEATETSRDSIKQLYKRQRGGSEQSPKRLTLSFNPILKTHWIYADYFSAIAWADDQTVYRGDDLSILKTWYVHNRFLTAADIHDLEHEQDDYFYQVYTLGNWGVLGNVIFTNWETRDLSEMIAQFDNRRYGLDFGFSSDPAAAVSSHYDRKHETLYLFDEFYERGLTNNILAGEVKKMVGRAVVVCDSAEPKSIAELQSHGVIAIGAAKGPDSVIHGIQWLQGRKIVIDKRCINARNEFTQYQWKKDKDGNHLRRPVETNDHLIAALRYACEADMLGASAELGRQPEQPSRFAPARTGLVDLPAGEKSRWKVGG